MAETARRPNQEISIYSFRTTGLHLFSRQNSTQAHHTKALPHSTETMEPINFQDVLVLPQLTVSASQGSSLSEDENIRPLLSPIVSEPDEPDTSTNSATMDKFMLTPGGDDDDLLLRSLQSASMSNANLAYNSRHSLVSNKSAKNNSRSYHDNANDSTPSIQPFIFNPNTSKVTNSTLSLNRSQTNQAGGQVQTPPQTSDDVIGGNNEGDNGNNTGNENDDNDNNDDHNNHRSRRPSSIAETIISEVLRLRDLTLSQLKRRRFFAVAIFSIICIFIFDMIFLPRTSLDRDMRRLYRGFLTFDDVSRIYINQLNYKNHVEKYIDVLDADKTHYPGGDYQSTLDIYNTFENLNTYVESYDVFMGTPIETSLKLLDQDDNLIFDAKINESDGQLSYYPYSKNGTIQSEFIYVNYGSAEDYKQLNSNSIDLKDKIFIIRINNTHPSLLIEKAQNQHASGIVFYKDPFDDGKFTERNDFMNFPLGYARNHDAIDEFTGNFIYYQPGDPTTPGWSPYLFTDHKRLENPNTIPKIPILPISFTQLQPILRELKYKGPKLGWSGNVDNYDYRPGPSGGFKLSIVNHIEYSIKPIHNIITEIPGIISDEEIIIGSSRDVISGHGGISKGSIGMFEIARGFDELRNRDWKPLRTIKLISWDGSSLGQLGSTEFGEYHSQHLVDTCIAYINFDDVRGHDLSIESNPIFNKLIQKVMKVIMVDNNETLDDRFSHNNGTIELISQKVDDYTVFQNHLGIPAINIGFNANKDEDPVGYYNSKYDDKRLLVSFDPDLELHNLLAQLIGMLVIELSEHEIIDVKITDYIQLINDELDDIVNDLPRDWLHKKMTYPFEFTTLGEELDLVVEKSTEVGKLAKEFDYSLKDLQRQIIQDYPWFKLFKKMKTAIQIKLYNTKVKAMDKMFISYQGNKVKNQTSGLLEERRWFRHLILAPSVNGTGVSVLPGLREGITLMNFEQFEKNLIALRLAMDRIYVGL